MSKLFDELRDLKQAYNKKLQEEGQAALKEVFKEVFNTHPRLKSIVWTEFTPYFNDGDVCTFRVHDFDVHISDVQDEEYNENYNESIDEYHFGESVFHLGDLSKEDQEIGAILKDVQKLESELPNDVLESVFGDHCKIVATPEKFIVEEYDHD